LNQRLYRGPFFVIGDIQVFSDLVHHVLSELGRVEVASRSAPAWASRTTRARIAGTAAVVILRE
jgi:hypothetical protein